MLDLILLAIRNIFRNTQRSIITILSITIGFSAMASFGGFIQFSFEGLRETTIRTQLGHVQIYSDGYWEKRVSDPASVLMDNSDEVKEILGDIPGISVITHRLPFSGLASVGRSTVNVSVIGIAPELEEEFSDFETIIDGRSLRPGDKDAGVIGEELQKGIGAKIGDWVTIMTSSIDGVINAVDFQVVGIVSTGSKEYDSVFVKISIDLAQRALETNKVERVIVLLDDTNDLTDILPIIKSKLKNLDENFQIRTWVELAGYYNAVVSLYTGIFNVFTFIVGVVVMFSVANTMTMAVFERTSEIGALRAIGASRATLIHMFLWEGLGIGLIGGLCGVGLSYFIAYFLELIGGIPMPPPPSMSEGYQAYLNITNDVLIKCFLVSIFAALISSLYPAYTASRINIVKALQK